MRLYKIPEATITRLSIYSWFLEQAEKNNVLMVSSKDIAKSVGANSAQVRKDLAYFGEFGTRGVGYNVKYLKGHITKILGLTKRWHIAVIGAGNLGCALLKYEGFKRRGFKIVAAFDNDREKIGKKVEKVKVFNINKLPSKVKELDIDLCIIAVPESAAQEVADISIKAGIQGIINFSSPTLNIPKEVLYRRIDLSAQLELMAFNLSGKNDSAMTAAFRY
jgi:redox-sensing transcriptional repressor